MGLITGLLGLPLAPVRGTVKLAEVVLEQAEREFYDPDVIRRQLEEVDDALADGRISAEEAERLEEELVQRLMEGRRLREEREGR